MSLYYDQAIMTENEQFYNTDFYQAYENYLIEPVVREAHDWSLKALAGHKSFDRVVDLGCGRSQEFNRYHRPKHYLGIDLEVESNSDVALLKGDYQSLDTDTDFWRAVINFKPTAFVSLFSSELTRSWPCNLALYVKLFEICPTLTHGLVSGLYYADKKDQPTIEAAGGITHQVLESLDEVHHPMFEERRTTLYAPSEMFGNEYEVWKLFIRKCDSPRHSH